MCELLPQYAMHLLTLARHCHVIDNTYVEKISICLYASIICSMMYVGVGCGWVCLDSWPKWVWGVGTQWRGIGVRGGVILESVIFVDISKK
jgi:hypothetical protein